MLLASTGVSTGVVSRSRIHLCGIGVLANISACLAEAKGSKPLYRAIQMGDSGQWCPIRLEPGRDRKVGCSTHQSSANNGQLKGIWYTFFA